jgi:hypothetical protein
MSLERIIIFHNKFKFELLLSFTLIRYLLYFFLLRALVLEVIHSRFQFQHLSLAVKITILPHYRYRPITILLPLLSDRCIDV